MMQIPDNCQSQNLFKKRLPELGAGGSKKDISGGGFCVSKDKELGLCRACSEDRTECCLSVEFGASVYESLRAERQSRMVVAKLYKEGKLCKMVQSSSLVR